MKIKKTIAKKSNPRAYLTGTKEEGSKLQLIVEVTAKRCPAGYLDIFGKGPSDKGRSCEPQRKLVQTMGLLNC